MTEPAFTMGIEEEYMLVNPETGDMVRSVPDSLLPAMQERLGERVSPEFLQSQIEVGTPITSSFSSRTRRPRSSTNHAEVDPVPRPRRMPGST